MNDAVTLTVRVEITEQLVDEVLGGTATPEGVASAVASALIGQLDLREGDFGGVEVELA